AEARRIFGLEDRAWTMEEVTNLGLPEYRESIRQKFLKLIQEGGSYDEEYPIQRLNDGATRFIHTVAEYDPERHVVMGTIQDITERQQAEEALRESEARFRSLVENSPYAIYVGSQKRFTYVNRAALRLFGAASEAELLGRPILEHIHPDFRSEVQDRICLLYEKKVLVPPREQVYLRLDGSPVEVEVSPAPIRYQGEDGALVFVHDITKRKAAENALRQERDLFSAGPVFTIGWRPEIPWPVIQVSSNVESILGYSPGEMTCPDFRYADLIHPDDLPRIAREAAGFLAQGRKFEQSYRLRNKNGNYQWFHDFSHLVRDKKGELSIRGYLVDLTSQKKAEKKLAAERQRLANVIEGTNAGTWEWNVPTGETVFNERWAQIAGYSLAELAPVSINTWINLTHPDDLQRSRQMLEKHFARESDYYECECRMRHKDGHWVWVRDCGRVITWGADGKPQHMYGIHMDITAAKKIEKTLKEREATLNSILMAAPAGIVLLRERVVVIWASRGLFDMTGYSEQELIGQNIRMLYPSEEEFERAGKTAYGSIQGREMVELESLWRRKDGAPVQVLIHLAFINPQDPSAGLICAALDISERKKSEELLRASEATLKGILRTAPVAICLLRERVFVWASSHVEAMTGYSEQELIGKSTRFLYPNDKEFERVGKAGYGRVVGRDLAQIETRWRRKDGQLIDLLIHLAPINPADPSEGFIGAVLDISEWKKAERLVRVSEATYRALFNAISAAVSVQDIWDLSVVEANPVFLDIYGYRAGELHNLHPRHFGTLADDADEALCRELRRRVMAGETVNVEIADRGKDGKAILVGKAIRRVNLNGIDRIMTVGQDITERKMMREIMVQTEKIMSLGGLAA
ncbi:MAG: PAS domain S-box protein, partial [Deltaproteobacteria bacterium]|nr:PAS domain S-box protein [Deltaproteobacteria bacterium]